MTAAEIATIEGLQYVQIPQPEWKGVAYLKPFADITSQSSAGHVETRQQHLPLTFDDVAGLTEAGWTRHDSPYWVRLIPPGGPRPPRVNDQETMAALGDMIRAIAAAYPKMQLRAYKAVQLVIHGRVTQTLGSHNYHVMSLETPGRTYHCHIPPDDLDHWTCTIVQDHDTQHAHLPCPDFAYRAPRLKHGRRCKHLLAAWMYERLAQKEAPAGSDPVEAVEAPARAPECDHSTTPSPVPQTDRRIAARYADGRPARYSDGTIVRYTAGGRAVELAPSTW